MTCKKEIVKLMSDNVERTSYDIQKLIGFSYGTTHRYVKELFYEGFLKEMKRDKKQFLIPKIYYVKA